MSIATLRPLDRFFVPVAPRFVVKLPRQLIDLVAVVERKAEPALAANLVEAKLAQELARELNIISRESFGLFHEVSPTRRSISLRTMARRYLRRAEPLTLIRFGGKRAKYLPALRLAE